MEEKLSLAQRLRAIASNVSYLNKDVTLQTNKGSYQVTSESKVLNAVRPQLEEHSLIVVPVHMEASRADSVTTLKARWRIIATDTGESLEAESIGQGYDRFDKGAGMAQTYALKYLFLKMLQIITGDDPDMTASDAHAEQEEQISQTVNLVLPSEPQAAYDMLTKFNRLADKKRLATKDQIEAFQNQLKSVLDSTDPDQTKLKRFNVALNMLKKSFSDAGETATQEEINNVG